MGLQYQLMDSEFDEKSLQEIAAMTGGHYFRATDNTKLRNIYQEIDQMEKPKSVSVSIIRKMRSFIFSH